VVIAGGTFLLHFTPFASPQLRCPGVPGRNCGEKDKHEDKKVEKSRRKLGRHGRRNEKMNLRLADCINLFYKHLPSTCFYLV
jgi:hypothetical protein